MEPFLFKKYDEVIGVAHDLEGLKKEIERLKVENPQAVEYHLREGHIAVWLSYIGRGSLAERMRGVTDIDRAVALIREELEGETRLKSEPPRKVGEDVGVGQPAGGVAHGGGVTPKGKPSKKSKRGK